MLKMILDAVTTSAPKSPPQVSELLAVIQGEMSRAALQAALGLRTANPSVSATSNQPWPMV